MSSKIRVDLNRDKAKQPRQPMVEMQAPAQSHYVECQFQGSIILFQEALEPHQHFFEEHLP